MSIPLTNTDLSAATAGSTGIIDLTRVGVGAGGVSSYPGTLNTPAHLFMFNESGCALTLTFGQTGNGFKLPAGAWTLVPLPMGEYQIKWSVDFLISGGPISLLLCTYYAPGEPTPSSFSLGNSPIGGAVTTSTGGNVATSLVNDGNTNGTVIIESTVAGDSSSAVLLTNGGQLTLGSAAHNGTLTVVSTYQGNFTIDINGFVTIPSRLLVNLLVALTGNDLALNVGPTHKIQQQVNNVNTASVDGTGLNVQSGNLNMSSGGFVQATGANDLILNAPTNQVIRNRINNVDQTVLSATALAVSQAINSNAAAFATLNGSVSGTCTFFMPFQGSGYKYVYVNWNNYRDASNRSVALPVQLNNFQYYILSDIGVSGDGGIQFLNNVTAQSMNVLSTIASTGGSGSNVTSVYKYSVGSLNTTTPVDHLNILSSLNPHTGSMQIFGV
jgi:hypothetical protein